MKGANLSKCKNETWELHFKPRKAQTIPTCSLNCLKMCHLYTCSLHDSTLTPPNSITIPLILSDFSPRVPKKNIIIPRFRFGAWCPCRDWKRCRLAAKLFRSPEPRNSVGGTSSAEPRAEGTSGTSRTSCHETRDMGLGRYWIYYCWEKLEYHI